MDMNIHIDHQRAIDLLEKAVELRGEDFVYTPVVKIEWEDDKGDACAYEYEGLPSCGVGWALSLAGVQAKVLGAMDNLFDPSMTTSDNLDSVAENTNPQCLTPRAFLRQNGITMTDEAAKVFETFQAMQDAMAPWGEALEEAKRVA